MRNIHLALSVSFFLATAADLAAQPNASFELVNELTACTAKLDAASAAGHSVDGLTAAKMATKGALDFLTGDKGLGSDRRRAMNEMRAEFANTLQQDPIYARSKVQELTTRCTELVYEAEDFRIEQQAADRDERARREMAEAELRMKEAQAARQAAITADREHLLELARLNAETERLKINKGSDLESERMKVGLEGKKIDATTSVNLSQIQAETDRLDIQKSAEVESERTKAGVETAKVTAATIVDVTKIQSEAKVAVAGKVVDIATAQENGATEREKINAAASTEIAKVESAAGLEAVREITRAQKPEADGNDARFAVMQGALECGGFYQVMLSNAPQNQQDNISSLAKTMFGKARESGADEQMVSEAPKKMLLKIKASAVAGKQALQQDLLSLKERCATFNEVAKL